MKRSVVFMMIYYDRKPVTRMSFYHMRKVMDMYQEMGVECEAMVFGDEEDQRELATALGFKHFDVPNKPLGSKFNFAIKTCCAAGKDFVCWLGSNNVHDYDYMRECAEIMQQGKVSFGSKHFIICTDEHNRVKRFTCRGINVCSSGQFINTSTLRGVNKFGPKVKHNFDGMINAHLEALSGKNCIEGVRGNEFNCVDIKSFGDLHTYNRYSNKYSEATRQDIEDRFEEVKMYLNGDFNEENYRTSVLGAYLSEKERT